MASFSLIRISNKSRLGDFAFISNTPQDLAVNATESDSEPVGCAQYIGKSKKLSSVEKGGIY